MPNGHENVLIASPLGTTWIYGYRTWKQRSNHPNRNQDPLLTPKKAQQVKFNVKVMPTIFLDNNRVVYYKFLPQGKTINHFCYLQNMRNLREAVERN